MWEVPLAEPSNPNTLTTAGNLVFQGTAEGDFVAFDATTGAELWRFPAGLGNAAPPVSYAVDGRRYVSLLVGWRSAYAATGGDDANAHGKEVYGQCSWCHGDRGLSGGIAPDLRASAIPLTAEAFEATVVLGRLNLGMPAYVADAAGFS